MINTLSSTQFDIVKAGLYMFIILHSLLKATVMSKSSILIGYLCNEPGAFYIY